MFEAFRIHYAGQVDIVALGAAWMSQQLQAVEGYTEFAGEFAGATFRGGLYRFHDAETGPRAANAIAEAFPEFAQRACPFGYDWLGRQFAVDSAREVDGQPQVLLLEPGTGEALEIPTSFTAFHDQELVDYADAALASEFFREWSKGNHKVLPLLRDQCVGYRVPLFLGGHDTVDNLEVSDLDVYVRLCGQLRHAQPSSPVHDRGPDADS